tara:strand:- start:289 stop:816 length:528 start_codon:yes stop_codon:yes gene_type:complete
MSVLLLENYIKELLKENKETIKKINIFDFDDTLFKKTNPLYYKGNIQSYWINDTVSKVFDSMEDPESLTVLCTARSDRPEVIYSINSLLKQKGLVFDDNRLYYKPSIYQKLKKEGTPKYKADVVKSLLNTYSYCKELHFWEDKQENLDAVQKIIDINNSTNSNRQILFVPHIVQA